MKKISACLSKNRRTPRIKPAEAIGKILEKSGATLATAESCTGGLLASRVTDIPGSSSYFVGSIVAYDNRIKKKLLKVSSMLLERFGAVSRPVACVMAENVRSLFGADWGIGITGIAGPKGGSRSKPVGLVFIAVSGPEGVISQKNHFCGNRPHIKKQSVDKALEMLRKALLPNRL